jgi:SAM-dependent methyltransferase
MMALSPARVDLMFESLGAKAAGCGVRQVDTVTLESNYRSDKPIRDTDFFRMLGFSEVKAIDVSTFEGAEITLDLNADVPPQLRGTCDFLVDGSTLDNVFDPISALRNAVKLLKPDGRLYLSNLGNCSPHYGGIPYLMLTPMWFYDFFTANDFADCQVCTIIYEPDCIKTIPLDHGAAARQHELIRPIPSEHPIAIAVFAERGPESTWHRTPTQHAYRTDAEWDTFESARHGFATRGRPPLIPAGIQMHSKA